VNTPFSAPAQGRLAGAAFDAGLRAHMLGVYRNMGLGLIVTGIVAALIGNTPALYQPIFGTPLKYVAIFAPLAFVFFFTFRIDRMTDAGARTAFYAFAAVMGVSLASIFVIFTGASIAASMFLGMSLWGYTTGRDLTKAGSFLTMGLIGIVVAGLVNIFLASPVLHLVISLVGVAIFTGLTAWDTQRIKSEYAVYGGTEAAAKLQVMGALSLYLNFVNIFQLLLTFFGEREE
jgi:FtsH-binding integral membrane protein